MVTKERVLKQLDVLLQRYRVALEGADDENQHLPDGVVAGLLTSAQAAAQRVAPPHSPYAHNATAAINMEYAGEQYKLEILMGIIEALRDDYEADALVPIQELIRGEVFEDFLEAATHLLESGYKDPAAVITGGVLEQHLRKLATATGIETERDGRWKKVDALNNELAAAGAYGKLDQKSVTAWLDLRNKAAHGRYDEYSVEQVQVFLSGVSDFVHRSGSGRAG